MRWLLGLVLIIAGCDDKLLREPATATGHDVTARVTELDSGRLAIQIRNGRAEPISRPRAQLLLYMVDGVPTLDIGPRELYPYPGYDMELPCSSSVSAIDPGSAWSVEVEVPHDQSKGLAYGQYEELLRQGVRTQLDSLRLRVWIFPHRGVINNCMGRFQKLPEIIVEASPDHELLLGSLTRRASIRAFTPTAERGVFHEAPPTPDQSTLYFIETDLQLKRPFEVNLLLDQPPDEP